MVFCKALEIFRTKGVMALMKGEVSRVDVMGILCIKIFFSGAIVDALGLEEEKESLLELGILGEFGLLENR